MGDTERVERMDADITDVKVAVARVETLSARTEDAVNHLNDKFDQLIERLTEHFPSRVEVEESRKVVETRLATLDTEVRELRSRSGRLPAWGQAVFTLLVGVVSAVLGGVYHV